MTNYDQILDTRLKLLDQGIIKSTGRLICIEHNGEVQHVPEPEQMHTINTWKDQGRLVRPGEQGHPVIIWVMEDGKFLKRRVCVYAESQTIEMPQD